MTKQKRSFSPLMARVVLLLASLMVSIFAVEVGLRMFWSEGDLMLAGVEKTVWRDVTEGEKGLFTADEELGYRPVLGTREYDENGTLPNGYGLSKPRDKTRVLFIGDSVTRRAAIVKALKERYGEESFEYWNAGVEGFNTPQEVGFYVRWNHKIKPDHVILTFHNNDFQVTPVAYIDDQDRMRVFQPSSRTEGLYPWLYDKSYIYKVYRRVRSNFAIENDQEDLAVKVRDSLSRLRDHLQAHGVRFSVILMPILSPWEEWKSYEKWSRDKALAIFRKLDLRFFDLYDPLMSALASGLAVRERPTDTWHPSATGGFCFADYLTANGLLGSLPLNADRTVLKVGKQAVQTLTCVAGKAHAGSRYIVLGSFSGVDGGPRWNGLEVPLRNDDYFRFLAANPNTVIANSLGTLDAAGCAEARVSLPPELVAKHAEVVHHAFIVFKEKPLTCTFVSNPVPLRFQR